MNKYFNNVDNTKNILLSKSKGLSDEYRILEYIDKNMFLLFNGSCLIKQHEFTFNKKTVNIYITYDLDSNFNNFEPTLENCLFGEIKITKNSDMSKYNYSGYGIVFNSKGTFLYPTGSFGNLSLFLELI